MIRLVTLAAVLTLAGCATRPVPVQPDPVRIPSLPASLAEEADPLPPIQGTDLHSLIRDGLMVDRLYADLRDRHNATVRAWDCVRTAVNNQQDPARCFENSRKDR